MNKVAFLLVLTLLIIVTLARLMGRTPFTSAAAAPGAATACQADDCREVEEAILRSTVRLHMRSWRVPQDESDESGYIADEAVGHATLRDGRYLVTHNHFSPLAAQDPARPISVMLFDSDGRLLFSSPLSDFAISRAGEETLVFELKLDFNVERLSAAGVVSADFADWRSLPLQEGQLVAQVDWDGNAGRIDWTHITQIETDGGPPRLVLADGVQQGASGGGVFWNGMHIANNWTSTEGLAEGGEWHSLSSVAALNELRQAAPRR